MGNTYLWLKIAIVTLAFIFCAPSSYALSSYARFSNAIEGNIYTYFQKQVNLYQEYHRNEVTDVAAFEVDDCFQ